MRLNCAMHNIPPVAVVIPIATIKNIRVSLLLPVPRLGQSTMFRGPLTNRLSGSSPGRFFRVET